MFTFDFRTVSFDPAFSSWLFTPIHGSELKSTRDCPKRARRIRLAVHLECCVTKTSTILRVATGAFFLQIFKSSCPSLHNPPMLERMNGRPGLSVRRRPEASLRGYDSAFIFLVFLKMSSLVVSPSWWKAGRVTSR